MPTAILAHDHFLQRKAKTAEALLRYGQDPVVAVVDQQVEDEPGANAASVVGEPGGSVPVLTSTEQALALEPDRLVIGVAPVGGRLPPAWRQDVLEALAAGVDVVSGMHEFLAEDPEMQQAAQAGAASIHDVRKPPAGKPIYSARILEVPVTVVLTVGTDCSSGKMTTTVELVRELQGRGVEAAFAATGQTGLMIGADSGVVVDAVPADFVAGWTEEIVLEAHEATGAEVVLVEGQGALTHPAYGAVSLGLLQGASPHGCILCHDAARKHKTTAFHEGRRFPVWDPAEEWALAQRLASSVRTPELLGVSAMNAQGRRAELATAMGAPVVDVFQDGPGELADAVEALL